MASYKVLCAAVCLIVGVVYTQAMPGGYATSYLVSNLDSYGGLGLSSSGLGGEYGGYSEGSSGKGLGGEYGGYSEGSSGKGLGGEYGGYSEGSSGKGLEQSGGESGGKYEKIEVYADHYPKYSFKYGVEDKKTGDYKDQQEERDGDIVKGEYSLLQPDGRKRIVYYTASKQGGFNAQVSYSGHAIHPESLEKY